jgi:hypothetical protein
MVPAKENLPLMLQRSGLDARFFFARDDTLFRQKKTFP